MQYFIINEHHVCALEIYIKHDLFVRNLISDMFRLVLGHHHHQGSSVDKLTAGHCAQFLQLRVTVVAVCVDKNVRFVF